MTMCLIEHHAMMFAYLSKHTIEMCGEAGKNAILAGMTQYGRERGRRMAARAAANGDPINTMTNQAYGEWKPDYSGQMEFGQIRIEPTLQTYIAKCAWCDSWKKHDILEYGKLYCVDVDNAVYNGYREDFVCTPLNDAMSWGGDCCRFDWGHPLTEEENAALAEKKKELGTSCMKDFNFHTAHIRYTITKVLREQLGEAAEPAIEAAFADYINTFGQEYFDVLDEVSVEEF